MNDGCRLVPILKKLKNGDQFEEEELRQLALSLELRSAFGRSNELPRAKNTSNAKAAKQVSEYGKRCARLFEHIHSMGKESLDAIKRVPGSQPDPMIIANQLLEALRHIQQALDDLQTDESQEKATGAGQKYRAREVTLKAAKIYARITGKQPKRTTRDGKADGRFFHFLREIFEALGIEASAESQERKLMEKRRHKLTD